MRPEKKYHSTFPYRSGESPIIGLGTLHMAHGGAFAWVGNYVGFSPTITDTGAGNVTVNIPVNFALTHINVHAQAITARMQIACILSAGPVVNGVATTNIQVLAVNDAAGAADADVMLVVVAPTAMLTRKTPIQAMGWLNEAALTGSWLTAGGAPAADSHPGFNAAIVNNGGTAGDYTVTIGPQASAAQLNLLVTPMTADRHAVVIKTDLGAGLGTSFRIVTTGNAAAAAESVLFLTVVDTMPPLGESPMIAGGELLEPGGGPGAWGGVARPGFAAAPITRNAQGDYTVVMGADNTTQIVKIFITPALTADAISYVSFPTANTARAVVKDSANGAIDSTIQLTAFII